LRAIIPESLKTASIITLQTKNCPGRPVKIYGDLAIIFLLTVHLLFD